MEQNDPLNELSEVLKNFMTRSAFANKYRFHYYQVENAIAKGQIATHCIDGKLYINVQEALGAIGTPKRRRKALTMDLFIA
jgi:hypothetical protein